MYEQTTLSNGLRIVTATMPHTRSAAVQFHIGVGARQERPDIGGVSHFIEHMAFKGTAARPSAVQISEAIEGVGGSMNAATDHEHTDYRVMVPSTHLSVALAVLTDMLRSSLFAPEEFEKERAVILEEISSTYDSPPEIADLVFDEMLWGAHPLGRDIAGSEESVRRITRQDLVGHVEKYYRPHAIVVSVAGNITHEEVVSQVSQLWGDMPRAQAHEGAISSPAQPVGPRVMSYRKRTEQTNFILGVPALPYTHPDRYTQDVLDILLGGGMSSRLFVEVRENRGLAYAVSSFVKSYYDVGEFGVYAAVDNGRALPALEGIMAELKRIRETPVPELELRKVKEYIKGHTMLMLERSGYVAQWAGWQELMLGRIEPIDQVLEEIEAISAEQVLELAQRLFTTDKLHLSVVGPAKAISGTQKALNLD